MKNIPTGAKYILWMDMAAQYSFYGMMAILPSFLVTNIQMGEMQSVILMQIFLSWRYLSMIGSTIAAETFLTQKTLMIIASVISVFGHIILSYDTTISNVYVGLFLIAVGIGIIKICIQPFIAYQAGGNKKIAQDSLSWLYIFTNIGTVSILITPLILRIYGYKSAFMSPTILVAISTIILLAGSKKITNPPVAASVKQFAITAQFASKELTQRLTQYLKQLKCLIKWVPLAVVISIFETIFAQMYSSWVIQGEKMDCVVFGVNVSPAQLQILDTVFIVCFVPLITFKILPYLQLKYALWKNIRTQIITGFVFGAISFAIILAIQIFIDSGEKMNIMWQSPAFLFLSIGEIIILCIVRNTMYSDSDENVRIKIAMLYTIISFCINSVAAFGLNLFSEINSIFFATCMLCMVAVALAVKMFGFKIEP